MKFLLISFFIPSILGFKSIPPNVLRELEIMSGHKININDLLNTSNNEKISRFNAYRDVEFELYTQKNPIVHQRVLIDDPESLHASNFNPNLPTKIIIHGCCTNGTSESIQYPRAGYMKKGNFNVFGVNWSKGADLLPFIHSFEKRMKDVGETVAKFIQFLISETTATIDDMSVIGHSAGAVTVSFVGQALNGTLPVQISLDPPKSLSYLFYGKLLPQKTDARYVEVMHTAAEEGGYFILDPIGHADFYPNGGNYQPYCDIWIIENPDEDLEYCNHMIAIAYFAESIASEKGFWSQKCKSFDGVTEGKCEFEDKYKLMSGEPIDTTEGIYYLETNADPPFAKGFPLK